MQKSNKLILESRETLRSEHWKSFRVSLPKSCAPLSQHLHSTGGELHSHVSSPSRSHVTRSSSKPCSRWTPSPLIIRLKWAEECRRDSVQTREFNDKDLLCHLYRSTVTLKRQWVTRPVKIRNNWWCRPWSTTALGTMLRKTSFPHSSSKHLTLTMETRSSWSVVI